MEYIINDTREKNKSYKIIRQSFLLDSLLEPMRDILKDDYDSYKNHALRIINYCFFMLSPDKKTMQHITVAAAYHQIGLWLNSSSNYAELSASKLINDKAFIGIDPLPERIVIAIVKHASLINSTENDDSLVSAFWKAFRIEISMGYSEQGLPSDFIEQVRTCIPVNNYNKTLTEKVISSFLKRFKS